MPIATRHGPVDTVTAISACHAETAVETMLFAPEVRPLISPRDRRIDQSDRPPAQPSRTVAAEPCSTTRTFPVDGLPNHPSAPPICRRPELDGDQRVQSHGSGYRQRRNDAPRSRLELLHTACPVDCRRPPRRRRHPGVLVRGAAWTVRGRHHADPKITPATDPVRVDHPLLSKGSH